MHLPRRRKLQPFNRTARRASRRTRRSLAVVFATIFAPAAVSRVVGECVPFASPPAIDESTVSNGGLRFVDLDGDGDDDLAIGSAGSEFVWLENTTGDASSWTRRTVALLASGSASTSPADLDGDGDLDLYGRGSSGGDFLAWYENDGAGGGWTGATISTSAPIAGPDAADLDGDGDPDLLWVTSGPSYAMRWAENVAGDASAWSAATLVADAGYNQMAGVADLDGDGDLDVLLRGNLDADLAWLENENGDASAWTAHTLTDSPVYGAEIADLDGDGDLDVIGRYNDAALWIENAAGDASSWTRHTADFVANAVLWIGHDDFDRDGDLDLVLTGEVDAAPLVGDPSTSRTFWLENLAGDAATWKLHRVETHDLTRFWGVTGDLDGDGDADLVTRENPDATATTFWLRNDRVRGEPLFLLPSVIAAPDPDGAESVFAADLDGDGDLDALSASKFDDTIYWYENDGDGAAWTIHTISTVADRAFSAVAADVDGDGDLDAVSASWDDNKLAWYENVDGVGGGWSLHTITTAATYAYGVSTADLDGDGDTDVLGAAYGDLVAWYENTDGLGGGWSAHTLSTADLDPYVATAADLDGDGDLDVLTAGFFDPDVAWFENLDGAGGGWSLHTISTGRKSVSAAAADVDGDGDVDAVASSPNGDDPRIWFENDGGGGGWTPHTIATSSAANPIMVVPADVDGDGDLDVLTALSGPKRLAWYENREGDGTAWSLHSLPGVLVGSPSGLFAADVDGDGDLDALSADVVADRIAWHENLGTRVFASGFDTDLEEAANLGCWSTSVP